MNYHTLSRRELQALCKQHKIPANKTNVFMADSLAALLNVVDAVAPAMVDTIEEVGLVAPSKVDTIEEVGLVAPSKVDTIEEVGLVAPSKDVTIEEVGLVAPSKVETTEEVAPMALSEESVGEVVLCSDEAEDTIVVKKTRGRAAKKTAVALVVPGVQDVCSAVKPAAKRIAGRGKVARLPSLTVIENCGNSETVEEKTEPTGRASTKPAMKSRNARALVKAATAPDSPGNDSATSSITREEDEPLDVAVHAEVDSMDDTYAIQGNRTLGPDQETPSPGGVFWFTKAPGHVEAMIKSDINGPEIKTNPDAKIDKIMLPEVVDVELPEDDLSRSISALTLVDEVTVVASPEKIENHRTTASLTERAVEVDAIHQSEAMGSEPVVEVPEVPKPAPKRVGRGKKGASRASPRDSETPVAVAEEVLVNHNDFNETEDIPMESQIDETEEAKPVAKKGRKAKKGALPALPPVEIEAAQAIVDDMQLNDNGNVAPVEPQAEAEEPKTVTKKGRKGKKGARAVQPSTEFKAHAAAVVEIELGTGNDSLDVHENNEPLPEEAEKPKAVTKKGRKLKKGTRVAHQQVDAEAQAVEADVTQLGDGGNAGLAELGNTPAVDEEQELGIEAPKAATKKVGGKKKKGVKANGGRAKATSPVLDVYVDIDFAKEAAVVGSEEPVSPVCNVTPNDHAFTSPVKSPSLAHMGDNSSSPVLSPSLAHMGDVPNSPVRSPSLAYMGNEFDCESDGEELTPVAHGVVQRDLASDKYGEEEADKENSLRKQDITEIPRSLRKLRKQVKEAIIKKKENTPVSSPKCSPFTDISFNLQSPRTLQSPSFSFQF